MANYSGAVRPGGPAASRGAGALQITKKSVGSMDNNAYLLQAGGESLLIDAAADPQALLDLVPDSGLQTVVTTHRHQDHWQALRAVVERTGATSVAHPLDAPALPVSPDVLVENGDTLPVGSVQLRVIHLRGHTPGGIALLFDDPDGYPHLFTGDSLFPGGPGRTGSPADFTSLMNDLQERVFGVLPDETWVYPGHGDDTTLGAERPHLGEWRDRGW